MSRQTHPGLHLFGAGFHHHASQQPGRLDLAIEILSNGTRRRDETLKRKLYEQFGVREHWLVDPELETVKVYRLTASGYTSATELSKRSADRLTTPLLPGLELPLSEIFP